METIEITIKKPTNIKYLDFPNFKTNATPIFHRIGLLKLYLHLFVKNRLSERAKMKTNISCVIVWK